MSDRPDIVDELRECPVHVEHVTGHLLVTVGASLACSRRPLARSPGTLPPGQARQATVARPVARPANEHFALFPLVRGYVRSPRR